MLISDRLYFQAVSNVFTLFLVLVMVVTITSMSICGNHAIFSLGSGLDKCLCFYGLIMDSSHTYLIYDQSSAIIRHPILFHLLSVAETE